MKLTIPLRASWHDHANEIVWAWALPDGSYRIANIPFYAYDISFGDLVAASAVDQGILYERTLQGGGHSTYRLFLITPYSGDTFDQHWEAMGRLQCSFERATDDLLAVDVPPTADIQVVYKWLAAGHNDGVWDFEEGHLGHQLDKH